MRTEGNSKVQCESGKGVVKGYGVSRATRSGSFVWNLLGMEEILGNQVRKVAWSHVKARLKNLLFVPESQ